MTGPRAGAPPTGSLAVIRIAILAGALAFGAVIWFLHRQPGWTPTASAEAVRALAQVLPVAFGAAMAAVIALRVVSAREHDPARVRALSIVGWGIAEAPALAGGVHYFLTDDPRWYLAGLFLLVASFVVLPIRRR